MITYCFFLEYLDLEIFFNTKNILLFDNKKFDRFPKNGGNWSISAPVNEFSLKVIPEITRATDDSRVPQGEPAGRLNCFLIKRILHLSIHA